MLSGNAQHGQSITNWIIVVGAALILIITAVGPLAAQEWSDITGMTGRYSTIYFDYDGNCFYCINDWYADSADAGADAGVLPTEYNRFPFQLGTDQYEIRIYGDNTTSILKNGVVANDSLREFRGAIGWGKSPLYSVDHAIWEFCFYVEPIIIMQMVGCDPSSATPIATPQPYTSPTNNAKSVFGHIIDGKFTDPQYPAGPPPVPNRPYLDPVPDPYWNGGTFTIELLPGGGSKVTLVPEPSSLLCLFGLLAGAVPFIRRR